MEQFALKLSGVLVKGDHLQRMWNFCEEQPDEVFLEEQARRFTVRKLQTKPESEEHHANMNKYDPSRNRPPDHGASALHTVGGGREQLTEDSGVDKSRVHHQTKLEPRELASPTDTDKLATSVVSLAQ